MILIKVKMDFNHQDIGHLKIKILNSGINHYEDYNFKVYGI